MFVDKNEMINEIADEILEALHKLNKSLFSISCELKWLSHGGRDKFNCNLIDSTLPFMYRVYCEQCKKYREEFDLDRIEELDALCNPCMVMQFKAMRKRAGEKEQE